MTTTCRIGGCPRPAMHRRTLCTTHHSRARRHGDPTISWAVPDPIAIDAAVTAERTLAGLTLSERAAAGVRLTGRGRFAQDIAQALGVTPRTVHRWRAAARTRQETAA